jgi:hypothetical protein
MQRAAVGRCANNPRANEWSQIREKHDMGKGVFEIIVWKGSRKRKNLKLVTALLTHVCSNGIRFAPSAQPSG